ncbi:hypothetical protein ACS5PK_21025 [Roseateles sp. DB2]|uniref:hypothetical protein n=1 Tax=Roseateles sp. DB2 TaxID=3453717 RepID=UPI003EEDA429
MPITDPAGLINFTKNLNLSGVCSVALDMIEGGVMGRLTTAIRDKDGKVLVTGGVDKSQHALITSSGRHVSWPFTVPEGAHSLAWAVVAFAPVANASAYKAQVTVINTSGEVVATSWFRGELKSFNDPAQPDGVFINA